ncbi:hypothetical protein OG613_47265 (plasmid) [Streptomyces sp. NBC_00015]|uniref:hypothetical protein n=1 Tax=Streptomyces sp. NBC_00015 TaxID=2903611 RepID=UPI002F906912
MPDAVLAARIRTELLKSPEHHDQSFYLDGVRLLTPEGDLTDGLRDCGTTLCVAGYAAHLTGHTIEVLDEAVNEPVIAYREGEAPRLVSVVAQAELGLSGDDAAWLFWGRRSREEVLAALGQLADGAPRIDIPAATAA